MIDVVLSPDQELAWDAIKSGKNLFVTARAGAGKSFLIDYIKSNFMGRVITTASTGVAANNVGGRTLHSQFLISTSQLDAIDSARKVDAGRRGILLRSARLLIIDEISMVSDGLLECVNTICKLVRNSDLPFGGLQVAFFGDFLQLPPVFKGTAKDDTICLECACWKEANIKTLLLTKNFRQQDDDTFFKLLTRLRYNKLTPDDVSLIKSRQVQAPEHAIRLYSLNAEVDKLNTFKYNKLDVTTEHTYDWTIWGEDQARIGAFIRDSLFVEHLSLRIGARVMMLVNEDSDGGYLYNGALGEVIGFENTYPVVQFDNGIKRTMMEKEVKIVEKDEYGRGRILVSCTQIPLKLAWACSIHKSQGQTFDSVFVDCSSVFVNGQVYVAFSRARNLSGLFVNGFSPYRARSDQAMANWYEVLEQEAFERRGEGV